MCGITGTQTSPNPAATAYYQRPNTKFVICVTPLSNANLQWTPNSGPNAPNPTNKDTTHATPVSSETYNVEYVDPNGCNSSDYISVSVDTGLRMVVSPHDSFSCNITPVQLHAPAIIAAGSTINPDSIFYTWTTNPSTSVAPPSGFGPSFANPMVNPGSTTTYICRINDSVLTAASCPIVDSAVIRRGTHLPVGKVVDSISCYGNTDGKIFINMTSGTAPYTYAWTPGGSSADSLTAIGAGTYTLLVTDQQGCTGRDTTILLNPAQLTLSLTSTDVSCYNGQNGTATALVNGGHSPYQYSWNPTQTNTGTLTSLSANTYQLTVTDLNSCTVTAQTTINQPTQLTSSATFSNLTGYNTHNGTIATHTLGGIAPYSYSWVHTPPISVGNVDSAWGLDSGTYIINITDHNGCTVSDTVVLIAPPPIVINITVLSNALCPGASTGSAYAIVSGGVPQYTYLWSNASSSTTDTVTGLSANTYSLTVTDHNGNTGTASTIITQPNPLYLRIDTSEVLCHGSSTGNLIDTSITGGTAPYTQFWNPAFLPNTAPGGMYILTVTDSNGCIAMDTAYLSDPPLLTAAIDISTPVTCYGYTNGTAHVLAAGGRPPYAYAWSGDTSTSALAISLSAGTATVTVTDFAGCTATASVNINQPTQLTIETIRLTNTHCATSHDGRAVAIDSGGVAPYTFTWDGTVGIDSITNLDQGQHTLLLTDASGCTATQTFNIDTIYVLHITMSEIDVTCFGGTNGNASTTVLNGTPAYTFAWSPSGGAQPSASNLSAGEQYVLVTDQYGCVTNDSIMVNQPNQIADTVYHIDPLCFGNHNGKAVVSIGNTVGPYSYTFAGSAYQNNDTVYNLASGIYAITITDGRGCTVTDADTLTDPTQLQMTDSLIHISCAGGSNGAIIIHAHGGTMPYTYTWTPPNTNDSVFSSLSQGQYTFTVTDAHGCQQKGAEQLQSPSPIIFTYIQSDSTSCADSSDGHIVVNVVGGTPGDLVPFTYSIDGINYYSNHNFYDLHAGTYTVYVKDSPGCVIDTPIVVGQPLALTVSIDPYDSVIALGGSITLTTVVSNFTTQAVNSHVWTPSVGLSCIDCANPVATPFLTTQYHLAVNYGKNCYTYADATVGVGHGSNVYIPNAFTPNGDGVNDVFSVYGSELSSVSMTVYNRWGEKIFDSGDNQWATWDGTYMGNLQSNGVYVYYVELTYLDGRKKTRQGSVTLIR
jgi:gliding motility-associated-like protein